MGKVIVYCADGTWNGSGVDERFEKDKPGLSNVFHLFDFLDGQLHVPTSEGVSLKVQTKELRATDGTVAQIAMYCHGVGENQRNVEESAIGGVFGGGLTTRLREGYAFISSQYNGPDDRIVIIGFSRGSYTARALADLIATRGLLKKEFATGHLTLSWAAGAWLDYRLERAHERNPKPSLKDRLRNLPAEFHMKLLQGITHVPTADQYVSDVKVAAIGVFDTVGAMGFPEKINGRRWDGFDFVASELKPNIDQAFHAVSLDEQRFDFEPTLWLVSDRRLSQVLFPGAHSDVGGGYTDSQGLSNGTLGWMLRNLQPVVHFKADPLAAFAADDRALQHRPWLNSRYYDTTKQLRDFSSSRTYLKVSAAVTDRQIPEVVPFEAKPKRHLMQGPKKLPREVVFEPYRPANLPLGLPSDS